MADAHPRLGRAPDRSRLRRARGRSPAPGRSPGRWISAPRRIMARLGFVARATVRRQPVERSSGRRTRASTLPPDGRKRVAIEAVSPEIDAGRFPAKRVPGESVTVEADVFADGHDAVAAAVLFRHERAR